MSLDYVGGGKVQVQFSVSLFSDADPLIQTGIWGPGAIPVTLRIDEITFESPATGSIVSAPSGALMTGLSSAGTVRGSLTVGTVTTPFSEIVTGCCAAQDAAPDPGGLGLNIYAPNSVVVGAAGGPGLFAGLGVYLPAVNVATVDGVTFSTGGIGTQFFTLTYVPEPSAASLLALAAICLSSAPRWRRRSRRGHVGP
jgi:hypothetical protein